MQSPSRNFGGRGRRARIARALRALLPFHPDRERECEARLEAAQIQGIDEDRLCEALYAGLVEHYWEQVRSQQARIYQESEIRVRRVRRDLSPLLKELWLIANDQEAQDLTTRLAYWMKHAAWIDYSSKKRRPKPGTPVNAILRKTRERLKAVGVKNYEWQSEWLKEVGLIETPASPVPASARRAAPVDAPLPPARPDLGDGPAVRVEIASWVLELAGQGAGLGRALTLEELKERMDPSWRPAPSKSALGAGDPWGVRPARADCPDFPPTEST